MEKIKLSKVFAQHGMKSANNDLKFLSISMDAMSYAIEKEDEKMIAYITQLTAVYAEKLKIDRAIKLSVMEMEADNEEKSDKDEFLKELFEELGLN